MIAPAFPPEMPLLHPGTWPVRRCARRRSGGPAARLRSRPTTARARSDDVRSGFRHSSTDRGNVMDEVTGAMNRQLRRSTASRRLWEPLPDAGRTRSVRRSRFPGMGPSTRPGSPSVTRKRMKARCSDQAGIRTYRDTRVRKESTAFDSLRGSRTHRLPPDRQADRRRRFRGHAPGRRCVPSSIAVDRRGHPSRARRSVGRGVHRRRGVHLRHHLWPAAEILYSQHLLVPAEAARCRADRRVDQPADRDLARRR